MSRKPVVSPQDFCVCYLKHDGDKKKICEELGISPRTFHYRKNDMQTVGSSDALTPREYIASEGVKRYILTCAQNNTAVEESAWNLLQQVARHYDAQIYVATFLYSHNSVKNTKGGKQVNKEIWFDKVLTPYIRDTYELLAPDLVWCGQMNTLPTAKNPLNGWDTYNGNKSGVFPHPKLQMKSVATGKHEPTKMNYTTGCVTKRHYIHKRAGLHADFHHTFGALLVEVAASGEWFARQLSIAKDGTVHDLYNRFHVSEGHSLQAVEALVLGDVHAAQIDREVAKGVWGISKFGAGFRRNEDDFNRSMINYLKPRYQVLHDVLDFQSASHHNKKDPLHQIRLRSKGKTSVTDELRLTASFLRQIIQEDYATPVIVKSNHDEHLTRWVKENDWRQDLDNAETLLEMQLAAVSAARRGFHIDLFEIGVKGYEKLSEVKFLKRDESFLVGEIEMAYHGDVGPNGARGSFANFATIGRKVCIGHSHSAGIYESVYVAGVSGKLDLGYNEGPSSWSHSHIVVYPNGKRAIITMRGSQWCL
jgi:hypothetical protein